MAGQEEVAANDVGLQDRNWLLPLPAELGEGIEGALYERWNGVPGNSVRNLTRSAKFRSPADEKGLLLSLEPPAQDGKDYGVRMRGYLVAPRSGKMRLVLSSDDNSEFWLSPTSDPFARKRVAWIAGDGRYGYSRPHSDGPSRSQRSAAVDVVKGQSYYFEAYHKERAGDDHFSLRWAFDNEAGASEIPPAALRPWTPIATDANDDGLPDSWQQSTGLLASGEPGSWGDPDHDGVPNFEEYRAGTPPTDGQPVDGFLLWESWYGMEGGDVSDLVRSPSFTGDPDEIHYLRGSATPEVHTGNYGSRLSGFVVPTESGNYQLAITGDNSAELWFSASDANFEKQRIAFSDRWRKKDQWDASPSQVGKVVTLEAGRAYYVEILHKDEGSPGWVALGWRKEGEKKFHEITPEFLRSPGTSGTDARREVASALKADTLQRGMTVSPDDDNIVFTEHGDPDQDGFSNWQEAMNGTNVYTGDVVPGRLTRQWWFNVPGPSLAYARDKGSTLKPPSMTTFSDGSEPDNTTDNFVSRLRGTIQAPVTGTYRFWIAGDDHCELWLSSNDRKYYKKKIAEVAPQGWESPYALAWTARNEWDKGSRQESREITLEAGRSYFVEILHKEGRGSEHVEMAWQFRESAKGAKWTERIAIPASALGSHAGEPGDIDDDYLPDDWEAQYGLDPQDNGLTDRAKQGENGDHDGEGLTNRDEFLFGTNPCVADTDGDGVGDYDELKVYRSNPVIRDASPPVVVATLAPGNPVAGNQNWRPYGSDGAVYSLERRGQSVWEFEVESAGVYRVDLAGCSLSASKPVPSVPVSLKVDGIQVGEGELEASSTKLSFMTPWLVAGRHEVAVVNHNVRSGVSMVVESLTILAQTGSDADGNGMPDWLDNYYRALNRVQLPVTGFVTSPASLEGVSRYFEDLAIQSGGKTIEAVRGVRDGWFANLALDPSGQPTTAQVSYEDGAIVEQLEVVWREINLLDGIDVRYVRPGDAVRLTAFDVATGPAGANVLLSIDSSKLHSGSAAEPFVHRFDKEGSFQVKATVTGPGGESQLSTVTFHVVGAELGTDFHVPSNLSRIWTPSDLPEGAIMEADDNLSLVELSSDGSRSFEASFGVNRGTSGKVIARLPDGGAILDVATIHGFFLASSTWTGDHQLVEVLPDGTRVIRIGYVIDGDIPPDLSLWIQMYVPDAVFANGSSWLHLTAANFDESGRTEFEIYKAPGDGIPYVCHWIRPYGEAPDEMEEDGSASANSAETPNSGDE